MVRGVGQMVAGYFPASRLGALGVLGGLMQLDMAGCLGRGRVPTAELLF